MKSGTFKLTGFLVIGILPLLILIQTGACTMSNTSGDNSGGQINGGGNSQPAKIQIDIAIEDGKYSLGGPIELTADYLNISDEPVSFDEPAKTWEVKLQVTHNPDENQEEEQLEAPFGRIFFYKRADGLERRTTEEADNITLTPNEKYQFTYDVGARWPELFVPGTNLVTIHDLSDDDSPIISNQLLLEVIYDESSFPMLLGIAGDRHAPIDSREFATTWIKKIYPEFCLTVKADASIHETEDNDKQLTQARIWWQSHQNDAKVIRRIKALNSY